MPGGMGPFSGSGGGPGGFFGGGGRDIKKDKENMIKANITLSDWAGSP